MLSTIVGEIFFPRSCLGCGTRGIPGAACDSCIDRIPINGSLSCGRCRARIPGPYQGSVKKICHFDFPYILGSAGEYDTLIIRKLIHALKFKRNREAAVPLGQCIARYTERISFGVAGFTVIPIPLSKRRERERGFNQSELIARAFAAQTDIPIENLILVRTRHASPQSRAEDIRERRKNVRGAFGVPPRVVAPTNVILIDDVTTSGATFFEAAQALKSAGTRTIVAMTAAKA